MGPFPRHLLGGWLLEPAARGIPPTLLGSVGNVKTEMASRPCKLGLQGGVPHAARLDPETFEKTHRQGPGKPPLASPCACSCVSGSARERVLGLVGDRGRGETHGPECCHWRKAPTLLVALPSPRREIITRCRCSLRPSAAVVGKMDTEWRFCLPH